MGLTMGTGPFGHRPAGTLNFEPPEHVVLVDPLPRRVRAVKDGRTVVDSDRVVLVHESRALPHYAFPHEHVTVDAAPEPHAAGYVRLDWSAADSWFEEDEEVFVHPRDPYHRIDTLRTSRRVVISLNGTALADSTAAVALHETGLPIRWYLPPSDVRHDLLVESDTVTHCAYKGTAQHRSAAIGDEVLADVAWIYEDDVRREAEDVRGRIAFYNERVDVDVDGVRQERPRTPWSR